MSKQRIAEALVLLALPELGLGDKLRLMELTAYQAGYEVRTEEVVGGKYATTEVKRLYDPQGNCVNTDTGFSWFDAPNYCESVDACLLLPIPDNYVLTLTVLKRTDYYTASIPGVVYPYSATTLPLAILHCWWMLQARES